MTAAVGSMIFAGNSSIARPVGVASRTRVSCNVTFGFQRFNRRSSFTTSRRAFSSMVVRAIQSADQQAEELTAERSSLVNRESVLFLFQLEMDAQLQRSLTYENFELAKEIRARRQQVDQALTELQEYKGYGCGARRASNSAQLDFAPAALGIRARMADAVAEERYSDAAALRDELSILEERAAEAELPCPVSEPRFSLGQMVVHTTKGYRGVVCGWDFACCESPEWQTVAGVDSLRNGSDQVFYHILVDNGDWPEDYDEPPVAYVAEELLDAVSIADFGSPEPLASTSFQHPYSYLMFLGSDGHGNMLPCRQLRDKYCVARKDVYLMDDDEQWEDAEEEVEGNNNIDEGTDGDGGYGSGGGNDLWGGGPNLPGIDMRSLD